MRQLTDSVWLLEGPTNIGFIQRKKKVILIDSGNSKESGRKINKLLKEQNWTLEIIINTHSNADHIGGNDYLQRNLNCQIYSPQVESMFIEAPVLETAFLWGGLEVKDIRNRFFCAKPSKVTKVIKDEGDLENGLRTISLKGHFFNMIGIMTPDNILFLADSLFGEEVLEKYKIPFIYDVKAYTETIHKLMGIQAEYYVPSHGQVVNNIDKMAQVNLDVVADIKNELLGILRYQKPFDVILKELCNTFKIRLDAGQYALVGSTTRSFLSYLYDENLIGYTFKDNTLTWERVSA